MTKYYQFPFGSAGDRASIPNGVQVDGSVNYTEGYGLDYSADRQTDPDALTIERTKWNQLVYDITLNIQQYQQHGVPEFITTSDNGGVSYTYLKGAMVRYLDSGSTDNYLSLVDANNTLPTNTTNWVKMTGNLPFLNKAQTWSAINTFSQAIVGSITGSAATLTTPRNIYGNAFDGSASITAIIASTYGGTGNGFTKFTGPTTTEKTFTLPNANAVILTDNALVTVAQGGTGAGTFTAYAPLFGGTTSTGPFQSGALGTAGQVLTSNGAGALPTMQSPSGTVVWGAIAGFLPSSIAGTSTTASLTVSAGQATDSVNAATILKNSTTSWAVTNGNAINGYSGGTTLPNSTTIHFFAVSGGSGQGVFASNSLSPTFPTGYTTSTRRIFSIRTTGAGALIPYTAVETAGGGFTAYLTTQVLDITTTVQSSTQILYALSVPDGIQVIPIIRCITDTSSALIIVTSPSETNVAPGGTVSTVPQYDLTSNGTLNMTATPRAITNTSRQIAARAGGTCNLYLTTRGYEDFRRT